MRNRKSRAVLSIYIIQRVTAEQKAFYKQNNGNNATRTRRCQKFNYFGDPSAFPHHSQSSMISPHGSLYYWQHHGRKGRGGKRKSVWKRTSTRGACRCETTKDRTWTVAAKSTVFAHASQPQRLERHRTCRNRCIVPGTNRLQYFRPREGGVTSYANRVLSTDCQSEESEAKKDCEGANIDTPPKPLDNILLEVPEPLHNSLQLALDPRWYHRSRQPPCCLALFASNSLNQHPH